MSPPLVSDKCLGVLCVVQTVHPGPSLWGLESSVTQQAHLEGVSTWGTPASSGLEGRCG